MVAGAANVFHRCALNRTARIVLLNIGVVLVLLDVIVVGAALVGGVALWQAWALWRQDNDSPLLSGRPSYGRSQAGAVLRYHLAPTSGHAPWSPREGTPSAATSHSSRDGVGAGRP